VTTTLTAQERDNRATHRIGAVDDCLRCIDCEVGAWNAHKNPCPV